jgi:hypothetical protein
MVAPIHVSIILVVTAVNGRVRNRRINEEDVWSYREFSATGWIIRIGSIVERKGLNVLCWFWVAPSNVFLYLF